MNKDQHAEALLLQGRWAATVLSRLLPTLKQRGIISAESLASATTELENARANAPDAAQGTFDDLIDRLKRDYGGGHFG